MNNGNGFLSIAENLLEDTRRYLIYMKISNKDENLNILEKIYKDFNVIISHIIVKYEDISAMCIIAQNLLKLMKSDINYISEMYLFSLLFIIDTINEEISCINRNTFEEEKSKEKLIFMLDTLKNQSQINELTCKDGNDISKCLGMDDITDTINKIKSNEYTSLQLIKRAEEDIIINNKAEFIEKKDLFICNIGNYEKILKLSNDIINVGKTFDDFNACEHADYIKSKISEISQYTKELQDIVVSFHKAIPTDIKEIKN